jgi:hypothetical protein
MNKSDAATALMMASLQGLLERERANMDMLERASLRAAIDIVESYNKMHAVLAKVDEGTSWLDFLVELREAAKP